MLTRMTPPRFCRLVLLMVVGAWTTAGYSAEIWLSEPEQAFFSALGVDAKVAGKPIDRAANLKALPEIARRAPNPLGQRISAIARAFDGMKVAPEEQEQFKKLMQEGQKELQRQMQGVVIDALFGGDSTESAVRATNAMMKEGGPVRKAWDLQRKWLDRGLAARLEADTNLKQITGELERRSRKTRPTSDLSLRVMVIDKSLRLFGRAGSAPLENPVVQVIMHKKSSQGAWTALNVASGLLVRGMGVEAMDLSAQVQGTRLSAAQERSANLPYLTTLLLPTLPAGATVDISLAVPAHAALGLERVALTVWTGDGTLHEDQLDGLESAQAKVRQMLEEQRAQQAAARGRPAGVFPFAQPPKTQTRDTKPTSPRKPISRASLGGSPRESPEAGPATPNRQPFDQPGEAGYGEKRHQYGARLPATGDQRRPDIARRETGPAATQVAR